MARMYNNSEFKEMIRGLREERRGLGSPIFEDFDDDKELLIFILYACVENYSASKARENIANLNEVFKGFTKGIMNDFPKYKIHYFIMPTKEESKIDLIFPKDNTPDEDIKTLVQGFKETDLLP